MVTWLVEQMLKEILMKTGKNVLTLVLAAVGGLGCECASASEFSQTMTLKTDAVLSVNVGRRMFNPSQGVFKMSQNNTTESAGAWEATKEGTAKAWDKTKEVSGNAWDATKEGTAKAGNAVAEKSGDAWEATKEGTAKAWEATKEGTAKAWDTTKEVSGDAWDATKEGTAKAWDKTKEAVSGTAD